MKKTILICMAALGTFALSAGAFAAGVLPLNSVRTDIVLKAPNPNFAVWKRYLESREPGKLSAEEIAVLPQLAAYSVFQSEAENACARRLGEASKADKIDLLEVRPFFVSGNIKIHLQYRADCVLEGVSTEPFVDLLVKSLPDSGAFGSYENLDGLAALASTDFDLVFDKVLAYARSSREAYNRSTAFKLLMSPTFEARAAEAFESFFEAYVYSHPDSDLRRDLKAVIYIPYAGNGSRILPYAAKAFQDAILNDHYYVEILNAVEMDRSEHDEVPVSAFGNLSFSGVSCDASHLILAIIAGQKGDAVLRHFAPGLAALDREYRACQSLIPFASAQLVRLNDPAHNAQIIAWIETFGDEHVLWLSDMLRDVASMPAGSFDALKAKAIIQGKVAGHISSFRELVASGRVSEASDFLGILNEMKQPLANLGLSATADEISHLWKLFED